jgi:deoxyribodipyrimidine photolyase-related protein
MTNQPVSIWILGDQLLRAHPAIAAAETMTGREQIHVVLVESTARLSQMPYQRKKLVLLLSAMRHYADWLRVQGYQVEYIQADDFITGLRDHITFHTSSRLLTMAASEYTTRTLQRERLAGAIEIPVDVLPNTQFLVGQFDPIPNPTPGKRYVMENFYRAMRRHFGVLMDGEEPEGGQWNYDKLNRKPLPADARPPEPFRCPPDEATQAVMREVGAFPVAVGTVDGFDLAVSHEQARAALDHFINTRLRDFGPYEDAMSSEHHTLYHSVLSLYVNIGLLKPLEMVAAAEQAYREGAAPLNSVEGFIRQVLGWREFMYWQYWRQMPAMLEANDWNATRAMPQMFWDGQTDMRCIRHVVERAIASGYTHHIERLMIICNFCVLAGIHPQAVNDWFLSFFIDAYDWVMQPNVVGMGLNADGGLTATKPYISSANYINTMSDYCKGCRYNHKQRTGPNACPFNALYWNFLIQHEQKLKSNPRFGPAVLGVNRIAETERQAIQAQAAAFLEGLT